MAKIVPAGLCTPGGGDGAVLGRGCDLPLPIGLVGVQRAFEHVDGLAAGTGDGSALQAIQMAFIVARASGPDGFARPVAIRSLLDPKIGASSKRAVFGMCAKRCDAPSLELPARIRSRATQRAGKASEARSRRAAGVGTSPRGRCHRTPSQDEAPAGSGWDLGFLRLRRASCTSPTPSYLTGTARESRPTVVASGHFLRRALGPGPTRTRTRSVRRACGRLKWRRSSCTKNTGAFLNRLLRR